MWVLTYHSISNGPAPLCIDAQRFAEQLDFLMDAGWSPVTLRTCVAELRSVRGPDATDLDTHTDSDTDSASAGQRFVVTFDDGYCDFAEQALPVLEARGVPSTLFSVATDERQQLAGGIDGAALLAREELRELAQAGVEIAGHGIDHVDLTGLDDALLEREIREGRTRLADWVGREIDHFAYPFGAWNERVLGAVAREYNAAVTTQLAAVAPDTHAHAIPRVDAFYLDDPGLRRAIEARESDGWLRTRRWLRRIRGSEPRRAIPQQPTRAQRTAKSAAAFLRSTPGAARGFTPRERCRSWL